MLSSDNAAATLKIRGGCEVDSYGKRAGKGCVDTMGVERDIGREPRSDAVRVVYALQGGAEHHRVHKAWDGELM